MGFSYNVNVLNQKGSPALYTDTFANRPAAGYAGRLFIANDTSAIYEDTGTAWVLIANVSSGAGTLQQVTTNGNTSNVGISITAGGLSTDSLTDTALTLGSVLFAGAAGLVTQDNAAFFWDDANNRLGINTTTPTNTLDLHFAGTNAMLGLNNTTGGNQSAIVFSNSGTNKWRIGNSVTNNFDIYNPTNATTAISIDSGSTVKFITSPKIKNGTGLSPEAGFGAIGFLTSGVIFQRDNSSNKLFFDFSGFSAQRTFICPNNDGTIALISDLGNYLLLSGGTLTGLLSGTIANFSSSVTATSFVKSGGTSAQILAANGSVITAGSNITISGGTISSTTPTAISYTQTTPNGSFSMSYVTITGINFFYNNDIFASGGLFTLQNFTIKSNTTVFSSNDITSISNTLNNTGLGNNIISISLPNLVYFSGTNTSLLFGSISINTLTLTSLKVIDSYFSINSSLLTSISLPSLEFSRALSFSSNSVCTSISLPNLKYVLDLISTPQSTTILISGTNNLLTSVTFPSIIRIKSISSSAPLNWTTGSCTNLNTFSFGSGLLEYSGNEAGTTGNFSLIGAALNQASVDNILIRLAALDGTGGTVTLSNRSIVLTGGTSSTPSATGLTAKAVLVARGCTVANN
jgi:hypothetical protein